MNDDFLYRDVSAFGNRIFRLGLSTTFGIDGEDLDSKRTSAFCGKKGLCLKKKTTGSAISDRRFIKQVHGLPFGFNPPLHEARGDGAN